MFNLFNKKSSGTTITLKLSGLHCAACPLNIDESLEELKGVIKSRTSYANQLSQITYDPQLVSPAKFRPIIENLGYKIVS